MRIEINYDSLRFLYIFEVNTCYFVMVFLCLISYFLLFKKEMEEWMSSSLCTANCVYFSPASFPSQLLSLPKQCHFDPGMPVLLQALHSSLPLHPEIGRSHYKSLSLGQQPQSVPGGVGRGRGMGVGATTEESVREAAGQGRGLISSLGIGRSRTAKTQTQDQQSERLQEKQKQQQN